MPAGVKGLSQIGRYLLYVQSINIQLPNVYTDKIIQQVLQALTLDIYYNLKLVLYDMLSILIKLHLFILVSIFYPFVWVITPPTPPFF